MKCVVHVARIETQEILANY